MTKASKSMSGKARSGGGATMNKNVKVGVRSGPPATKIISPSAASNIGLSKGNHAMDKGTVKRPADPLVKGTASQVPSGNAKALAVGRGGPGADRIVHKTGSQAQHGPVRFGAPESAPTPGGGPGGFGFKGGK